MSLESERSDQRRVISETKREVSENRNPLIKELRIVSFVSTSSGRDRKRKPREVTLLVVANKYAYQIVRGDIRPRKKGNGLQPDELAVEVLSDEDHLERTPDLLLKRLGFRS